jgi:hypothetical protein
VRFAGDAGAHGWDAAGSNELWVDATVVFPLGTSYLTAASATRGAAAALAAKHKHAKYRDDIPGHVHFLPLPFESEGYHCAELERLLLGFAHKRASSDNLPPAVAKDTARRWLSYWLDHLAVVHARYVARCVYNRASACKDARTRATRPSALCPPWTQMMYTFLCRRRRPRSRRRCSAPLLPLPLLLLA